MRNIGINNNYTECIPEYNAKIPIQYQGLQHKFYASGIEFGGI